MTDKIRDDYRKFDELLDLIRQMSRPTNGLTYEDIMDILHCSRKTAERSIKFLSERFPDAFFASSDALNPKIRRFKLESADGLPPDYLSTDEVLALNGAVKKIKDPTISDALASLEYKLNRMLQVKKPIKEMNDLEGKILSRSVTSYPHPHIIIDSKILNILQRATLGCAKVNATYLNSKGETKTYILCPLGFLYGSTNDYLVAYENIPKGTIKQFVLSGFKDVQLIKTERFNPGKFDINEYSKASFGAYHSDKGPYEIVWRVSAKAAKEAKRYLFHPSQKITENKDGSLTVRFKGDGLWEICWHLFQWQGEIVPVSPLSLVETYKEFLEKCQKSLD